MNDKKIPTESASEKVPMSKPPKPTKPMETSVREMNEKLQALALECQADGNFLLGSWALESRETGEVRIGFVGLAKQIAHKWAYPLAVWNKLILAVTLEDVEIVRAPPPNS